MTQPGSMPTPPEAVQAKPRALTFEQAASVGISYLTAWHAIIDVASLKEGETVLITGTTGRNSFFFPFIFTVVVA